MFVVPCLKVFSLILPMWSSLIESGNEGTVKRVHWYLLCGMKTLDRAFTGRTRPQSSPLLDLTTSMRPCHLLLEGIVLEDGDILHLFLPSMVGPGLNPW